MVLSFKFVCALFQFSELSPLLGRGRSCACVSKLQMRGEGLMLEFLPSLDGEGGRRPDGVNSLVPSHTARSKCHNAQSQEQFTPVMLNLFQHLTSLSCNLFADKILKLSWIIRGLAGVTSRSTLRARLHRCPTENPRVQDDNLTMEGLLCFP